MLTSKERERAILDESLRQEVRSHLNELAMRKKTRSARLGALANSPFVLWLLSTVVVGVFTWCYAELESANAHRESVSELNRKLRLEAAYRTEGALQHITALRASPTAPPQTAAEIFSKTRVELDVPGEFAVMYPEFKERNYYSLLTELWTVTPAGSKRKVRSAMVAYKELREWESSPPAGATSGEAIRDTYSLVLGMREAIEAGGALFPD